MLQSNSKSSWSICWCRDVYFIAFYQSKNLRVWPLDHNWKMKQPSVAGGGGGGVEQEGMQVTNEVKGQSVWSVQKKFFNGNILVKLSKIKLEFARNSYYIFGAYLYNKCFGHFAGTYFHGSVSFRFFAELIFADSDKIRENCKINSLKVFLFWNDAVEYESIFFKSLNLHSCKSCWNKFYLLETDQYA